MGTAKVTIAWERERSQGSIGVVVHILTCKAKLEHHIEELSRLHVMKDHKGPSDWGTAEGPVIWNRERLQWQMLHALSDSELGTAESPITWNLEKVHE